jgi:hypothetical protein
MNYWRHGILSLSLIREILFPSVKSVVEEPPFPPKALDNRNSCGSIGWIGRAGGRSGCDGGFLTTDFTDKDRRIKPPQ